jgi:hypothetical protein
MGVLAVVYPKLPRSIRHWFKDYCLNSLDADIRAKNQSGKRQGVRA